MEFSFQVENRGDSCLIKMIGDFDTTAGVRMIRLYDIKAKSAIINLKEVNAINSSGVRSWINFLQAFQFGCSVTLTECSPVFVSTMIMMPSFKGNSRVESAYIDCYCEKCDADATALLTEAAARRGTLKAPFCASCNCDMKPQEDLANILALFAEP